MGRQGGSWSEPRTLHADGWKIEGCPVNGPALDASGRRVGVVLLQDGDALVSWLETRGKDADFRIRRVSRDGSMHEAFTVARIPAGRSSGWLRMVQNDGTVVFAWTDPGRPSRIETALLEIGKPVRRPMRR